MAGIKNFEKAEPLFEAVKKDDSPFKESATYYFAYINYLNKEYKIFYPGNNSTKPENCLFLDSRI